MVVELSRKEDIPQMRLEVHEWLNKRHSISHTPLTLHALAKNEFVELQDALANHLSQEEINLELGDFLFVNLAQDDRQDPVKRFIPEIEQGFEVSLISRTLKDMSLNQVKFFTFLDSGPKLLQTGYDAIDSMYAAVNQYATNHDLDITDIFEKTLRKNRIHYPTTFFGTVTPFFYSKDAIRCLRVFRKVFGSPEDLHNVWIDLDHHVHDQMAFYDEYWIANRFRNFIKNKLKNISKIHESKDVTLEAKKLLSIGVWTMVPFKMEKGHLIWD